MVPDVLVSGRADLASVIGWALQQKAAGWGYRRIAAQLRVPADTARGWLRRAAERGWAVAGRLVAAAAAADPAGRDPPAGGDVFVTLVAAAGLAARAYAGLSGEPVRVWRYAVLVCGSRLLG